LERGRGSLKKWIESLPFLGAILLSVINVDLVVVPLVLRPMDLSFWAIFWIAMPIANLEIIGWVYFWKWFAWSWLPKTEPIKETIELTKNIIGLLREYGLFGTIVYKVRQTFKWAVNPEHKASFKKWGHVWMLFLGSEPFFSGGRLLGVISCGATRWKVGLVSLCVGNTLHVYLSIKSWDLIFYLWREYGGLILVFIVVIILFWIVLNLCKKYKKTGGEI